MSVPYPEFNTLNNPRVGERKTGMSTQNIRMWRWSRSDLQTRLIPSNVENLTLKPLSPRYRVVAIMQGLPHFFPPFRWWKTHVRRNDVVGANSVKPKSRDGKCVRCCRRAASGFVELSRIRDRRSSLTSLETRPSRKCSRQFVLIGCSRRNVTRVRDPPRVSSPVLARHRWGFGLLVDESLLLFGSFIKWLYWIVMTRDFYTLAFMAWI